MSASLSLPAPTTFNGVTYRTIYTIKESQSLYDDLVLDTDTLPVLQSWDNESSGIDHSQTPINRPFQYAEVSTIDVLIDPLKWKASRFSDGTFGVWYGSFDAETAIQESLYQSYIFAKECPSGKQA